MIIYAFNYLPSAPKIIKVEINHSVHLANLSNIIPEVTDPITLPIDRNNNTVANSATSTPMYEAKSSIVGLIMYRFVP